MGVFARIEQHGERPAVITDDGRTVSYRELVDLGDAFAAPIPRRCLVLQVCRNDLGSLAAYVGLQRAGMVTMLVNHKTDSAALLGLITAFRPAYVLLPDAIDAPPHGGACVHSGEGYRLFASGQASDYPLDDALALLLGTSGSTGSPDYVRLSAANLVANTASIIDYLGVRQDDRAITTMPMSYSYGLSIINTHLAAGATLIATEATLMERRFWTLLQDAGATTFGGVPFVYEMLQRLKFAERALPHLRYITQAGGRLAPQLVEAFARLCADRGIGFVVMYGQTEATARIAYVPPTQALAKSGSIGIAIPGGRIWLADTEGQPVQGAEVSGEIVYEGANVSLGCAQGYADLGKGDLNHGILFTGDMARRDADGYHYILGRKSRFVKVFGNRVGLDALEQVLHAGGIQAVCGGRDDDLVIYTTAASAEPAIRRIVAEHTAISRQGYRVCLIDEIPRSDAGKVQYARLPYD